jgi:hypothetical protein
MVWQHMHVIQIFLLIGLIIFLFENSIANDFAFDGLISFPPSLIICSDHLAIVNNADTDPSQPFVNLWGNDIWGKVCLKN